MSPSNTPSSELNHSVEQAALVLGAEAGAIAPHHGSPSEDQKQAVKTHEAIAIKWARRSFRPLVVGGALGGPLSLYVLTKLPDGLLWGPIELHGVGLGGFMALGSFAGILVVGVATRLARIIAPTPLHYWSLLEVWSKYQMGRIPPEQYYEHGAVLDYQRLYRDIPPHDRPETQVEFVRRVVRWRKAQERGERRGARKGRSSKAPAP
jgi:hypothetical protein